MSWMFYAFLSAVMAALVAIFAKMGLKEIDSTLATTIRALIMAGFLLVVSLFLGKFDGFKLEMLSSREWTLITLAGIAGALSWLFYFFAIQQGTVSQVVAIDKLSILFVVILAAIFLREAWSMTTLFGAVLMVLGAIFITLNK